MQKNKYKIAIVDDEHEILSVLERYLNKNEHYQVKTFSNPLQALSSIDKSYDIVLCDIMMPQMNGLDLLDKLLAKNPQLQVVMMTAYSTLNTLLTSHRKGAQQYIMKPFTSLKALDEKLISILEQYEKVEA
ncbi:MAG: response regulator [Epsilonproteobacteria bacterium]|nr:response regulator [Campylobacterota bacterium]